MQKDEKGNEDCDCLMVIVMTHGGKNGSLWAYDYKYQLEDLWVYFQPTKCPSLTGIPKIFIIQVISNTFSIIKT